MTPTELWTVTNPIPTEVWAIMTRCGLLPPMDEDGTDAFMAWTSKEAAERGLEYQQSIYDLDGCSVVQIK